MTVSEPKGILLHLALIDHHEMPGQHLKKEIVPNKFAAEFGSKRREGHEAMVVAVGKKRPRFAENGKYDEDIEKF